MSPTRLSWILLAGVLAGACSLGEVPPLGDDGVTGADANPLGGPDSDPALCEAARTPIVGHHNEGLSCMVAGCHAAPLGAGAPPYTVAGTLYVDQLGTTGISGGTIIVTDASVPPVTLKLTTSAIGPGYGNFFTTLPVTLPLTVQASKCPAKLMMTDPADAGSCNGCHTAAAAQGRIHL